MANKDISSAEYGDMTNTVTDFSVSSLDTDGATGYGEVTYIPSWTKWNGYYKTIPELQAVIDAKARWTVGKGYKADEKTTATLKKIKGFGKDSFNTIMSNAVRTFTICGDFFAEIVKDKAGRLINLKPLNPGSIQIVIDELGTIVRYEQVNKTKKVIKTFDKDEIFHLAWNRIADEMHGISTIEKCEKIILMRNESMEDLKKVFHRYVKPIHVFKLDTDDETTISAFKLKADKAVADGENLFIPKDAVDMERVSIPQYSTLDPLPWLLLLQRFFIMSEGVPELILGHSGDTTEASGKMLYLAFQQMVEYNQLFLEEQLKLQLNIDVEFEFPASIEPSLLEDQKKDSGQIKEMNTNPVKDG